jgi:MFS transporter, DHA1 family, multidrug resistance protein
VFVALAILSAVIAVLVAVGLLETHPVERRTTDGLGRTVQTMGRLLRDRSFLGHGLTSGLTFGTLFAYISGSSFVLQDVAVGGLSVWALLIPMFAIVSSLAFVLPNATALALADHAGVAGTASALLGLIQFLVGALAAPFVGVAGPDTALPMGVIMVALALGALVAQRAAGRRPWRLALR